MSLTIQKGFWQDSVIANTQNKLAELYRNNPDIAKSEKRCILEYWLAYEGLQSILCDKWGEFQNWFTRATSPETITRCLRGLKENGTIELTPEVQKEREERQQTWRSYWGNEKRGRESSG